MDDDMEDEIIYQCFTVHFHLMWKYVSATSSGIIDMVMPGPGESFKTKFFQPGLFMTITLLVIVLSLLLQSRNNWLQQLILSCHRSMTYNVVADSSLKTFVTTTIGSGDENVRHDLVEGAAGVYALQGRRGNMEDRFSIMQHVDVGGQKKISLFGVYDGHGGQYVAEYVKENLFVNTIEKIKQLRKDSSSDKINKRETKNSTANGTVKRSNGMLGSLTVKDPIPVVSPSIHIDELTDLSEKEPKLDSEESLCSEGIKVTKLTEEPLSGSPSTEECLRESLKKEDPYSNLSLRKKNSIKNAKNTSNSSINTDKPRVLENDDSVYIDSNSNINYTKLLTDQIMEIDKKLVDHCKSNLDLSGTTAIIAVLDGEHLIIGNVGDSRAVMGDLHGTTIPLSFDHKPNQLKEMKRIKEAGGFITFTGVWRVAGILATSRALGDFPLKDPRKLITAEPDVLTFSLKDHKAHFVVLATDGLWDVMSNEDVVAYVRSHIQEKDFGAKSLVMHAYNKGSMDNITVTILNISQLI